MMRPFSAFTVQSGTAVDERSTDSHGWAGIFNTHFWVDPKKGIGVVFLTQEMPFNNLTNRGLFKGLEKLIYEHLE